MPNVRRAVAIVVAAYLLLVFYDRFVLVELFARRVGVQLLVAAIEAVALIGVGFLVRGMRGDLTSSFLIGYPIFGAICFLVGTIGVSSGTMIAVVVVFTVAGAYAIARRRAGGGTAGGPPARREDAFGFCIFAILVGCAIVAVQAPPATLDELAYHLAVPWSWVKEHRAIDLPLLSHSYFPLGIESADLPLLTIFGTNGAIASHWLHLGAAIATTMLLLRRTRDSLLTAAIVATPALAVTAGWSLVDWPLLGLAIVLAAAVDDADDPTIAAALGAGLLTKYTLIPIAIIILFAARYRRLRPILIGLAIGSIFFIRNLVLAGNPIAPFLSAGAPHVAGYRAPAFLSDYVFDGRFLDESLGASLLAACAMTTGLLGWTMLVAGVLLFALAPSARILVPFFAVAASRARLLESRALRVMLAIAVVAQTLLIVYATERTEAFSLIAGRSSDEEYVTKARVSVPVIRALDAALPRDSVTLVVGVNETFWFAHRVRGGGNFDGPRMSQYLAAPTAEALYARLRHDGITHVAVVSVPTLTNIAKKLEERDTALTPDAQKTLVATLNHYAANVSAPNTNATLFALR